MLAQSLVAAMLLFLSAASRAQTDNLLDQDFRNWSVQYDPNKILMGRSADRLTFASRRGITKTTMTVATTFTARTSGPHVLWTDAAASELSRYAWLTISWSIPGVANGYWSRNRWGARNCSQWLVHLAANQSYRIEFRTTLELDYSDADFRPMSLRPVRLPVFLPQQNFQNDQSPWEHVAEFEIHPATKRPQQGFVLLVSPWLSRSPLRFPGGDLWLLPGAITSLQVPRTWRSPDPGSGRAAYSAINAPGGLHWQVAEFDPQNPATTLRLGSPTQTKKARS